VADEPTGDLDARNAEEILSLLQTLKRDFGRRGDRHPRPRAEKWVDEVIHLDKAFCSRPDRAGVPEMAASR